MKSFAQILFKLSLIALLTSCTVNNLPPSTSIKNNVADVLSSFYFNDTQYFYVKFEITDLSTLSLTSNLPDKLSTTNLIKTHHCTHLINAGFYNTTDQHIGWFVQNFNQIAISQTNKLFDGFFWIDSEGLPHLDTTPPDIIPRLGLQTGPILYLNGKPVTLSIKNDESKRRSVLIITENNTLIFIHFTQDQVTTGPFLQSLPMLLTDFALSQGISINHAINLDGGSASAIITPNDSITELNPIGSYFCQQT